MSVDDAGDKLEDYVLLHLREQKGRPRSQEGDQRVPTTDPSYPEWCVHWGLTDVHLSTSVLCVTVRPRQLSALTASPSSSSSDSGDSPKAELRTLLRFLVQLAAEYGLLRPVACFVLLDRCDFGSDHPDSGWILEIDNWASDQDWHRGEFLVFVAADYETYCDRCLGLLEPVPNEWSDDLSLYPRSAENILESAREEGNGNDAPSGRSEEAIRLLDEMQEAVDSDPDSATGNPLVDSFRKWLKRKLSQINSPRKWTEDVAWPRDEGHVDVDPDFPEDEPLELPVTITRVIDLEVKNFRGFGSVGSRPFDLDADLVLLAGPNGTGKTSVIEALDLLLTGYHHFDSHHLFHGEATEFTIKATVRLDPEGEANSSGRTVTVECSGTRIGTDVTLKWFVDGEEAAHIVRPLAREFQQKFGEEKWDEIAALLSRRTVVYPDRLEKLFDETTKGVTLRQYLDPTPPVVAKFLASVNQKSVSSNFRHFAEKIQGVAPTDADALKTQLETTLRSLKSPYGKLTQGPDWPQFPQSGDDETLFRFVSALSQRLDEQDEQANRKSAPDSLQRILLALHKKEISAETAESQKMINSLTKAAAKLRDAWQRCRVQSRLDALQHTVERAVDLINRAAEAWAQESFEKVRVKVESIANMVLSRVASTGGSLLVSVKVDNDGSAGVNRGDSRRGFTIKTEDGRDLDMLSFGQRTQLGVAMVIAENRVLERQLGHRVFLLDDLSATYDLANLSRDAVFWRQLAYGSGAANESGTRQVVLSTHHEDLTNRLLDVMPPVEKRRMLLYRFTAWKKGRGPTVKVYSVEPELALNKDDSDRETFRVWLYEQLAEGMDAHA